MTDIQNENTEPAFPVADDVTPVNSKERRSLYAKRQKVYPQRISGVFRQLKWYIMAVTLGIYYLAPWIRWSRGEGAPDQAILIDFSTHRFYFFFIEIWPQELFFVAGLLIMAGFGLFLAAAIVGRVWCGYFCPQTVWVDLFIKIERWVEGDRNARIRLDKAPWSFAKLFKRLTKYAIWLIISVLTGGAWVFYFADAPTFIVDLVSFEAPLIAYTTIGILTAFTFVFGGFAREQVCTYMCPWPRIQAAMGDEDTFTITYRKWRGEPRGRHAVKAKDAAPAQQMGDCVDCNRCVAVCPMGIDIRDGQQLECITCGLCIDACNAVMEKVGRAPNLIAYDTFRRNEARAQGVETDRLPLIRPRTVIYLGLWLLVGLIMVTALALRDNLDLNVIHDRNPLFVTLSDGSVRNGYTLKLHNKLGRARPILISVEGLEDAVMQLDGANNMIPIARVTLPADKTSSLRVFVIARGDIARTDKTDFKFRIYDPGDANSITETTTFRGKQ